MNRQCCFTWALPFLFILIHLNSCLLLALLLVVWQYHLANVAVGISCSVSFCSHMRYLANNFQSRIEYYLPFTDGVLTVSTYLSCWAEPNHSCWRLCCHRYAVTSSWNSELEAVWIVCVWAAKTSLPFSCRHTLLQCTSKVLPVTGLFINLVIRGRDKRIFWAVFFLTSIQNKPSTCIVQALRSRRLSIQDALYEASVKGWVERPIDTAEAWLSVAGGTHTSHWYFLATEFVHAQ